MTRFWGTVAFRLALGYGLLAVGSMTVISAAFYFGTVGVLARSTDAKLLSVWNRLAGHFERSERLGDQALGGFADRHFEVSLHFRRRGGGDWIRRVQRLRSFPPLPSSRNGIDQIPGQSLSQPSR